MSSFRWGKIASPTPTNSQVTVRDLRHLLFSSLSSIVLLTVLHSEVQLGSACIPPHFGLSFCNALEEINPPYPIWKGTSLAFIWGIVACPVPRICRDMALVKDPVNPPRSTLQSYPEKFHAWFLTGLSFMYSSNAVLIHKPYEVIHKIFWG